jgi:heat shock protein HtpX
MSFLQVARRVVLLLVVNWLVMLTIGIILGLFFHGWAAHFGYGNIFVYCFVFGMGGAFVSLALSRWMAIRRMGVQVIDPGTANSQERQIVETVHGLARAAGLSVMPDVGIYDSPEVNAFATGPSRSRALVAVSSGLLNNMRQSDIQGVLGHEITHIVNGDMVTMTLIQGVINAFAMFLAEVAAIAISQGNSRDDERGGSYFMEWMIYNLFYSVLALLGSIVVCWFSRWREFRADAGGAHLAGRDHMISALRALEAVHQAGADQTQATAQQPAFQALKISGKTGGILGLLFADHPPLEERIARLQSLPPGY